MRLRRAPDYLESYFASSFLLGVGFGGSIIIPGSLGTFCPIELLLLFYFSGYFLTGCGEYSKDRKHITIGLSGAAS